MDAVGTIGEWQTLNGSLPFRFSRQTERPTQFAASRVPQLGNPHLRLCYDGDRKRPQRTDLCINSILFGTKRNNCFVNQIRYRLDAVVYGKPPDLNKIQVSVNGIFQPKTARQAS